ncbi:MULTISPECIES: hypothetical protein [Chromobacterium]|uniref:hypothetical protein n=1 Tax=Chromobacterium TaxID=535 RepID=UPI001886E940|nr:MULTISPECIES: hypothetical protein [Chromobacterium]WON85172.1 hypothetical protein OK026_06625 [Chromobacterium haemolyticum]
MSFARERVAGSRGLLASRPDWSSQFKPDHALITRLDLVIEPKLRERILLRYPDHGVLDEEFGARRTGFIGAFGVLGAALSGYLLAKVIDVWGWNGFFLALSIPPCCRTLLLPLLGQRKHLAQRVAGPDEA